MRRLIFFLLIGVWAFSQRITAVSAQQTSHLVQPGDTWAALAARYNLDVVTVQAANPHMNQQRQPTIGTAVFIPTVASERAGRVVRPFGSLLETAVLSGVPYWQLAQQNQVENPFRPLLLQPLFVPGGDTPPRELPMGFETLELSQVPAHPGQAIGWRAVASAPLAATAQLNEIRGTVAGNGRFLVGLLATGAFYMGTDGYNIGKEPELLITPENSPAWAQPWLFSNNQWEYQELTLTGAAAEIDQESIQQERERLFAIWSQVTPTPSWASPYQLPITNYLSITSTYGARRSYNGGPYRTYHEGLDFAAYGGTPVFAPAAGTAVVAEFLYVRGGAVILDHGLGVYTGYYHMSSIAIEPGQAVQPGDLLGEVGTTGLSTGNHLHWDLLVVATWVDPAAWMEQNMACWVLAGWGTPCQ